MKTDRSVKQRCQWQRLTRVFSWEMLQQWQWQWWNLTRVLSNDVSDKDWPECSARKCFNNDNDSDRLTRGRRGPEAGRWRPPPGGWTCCSAAPADRPEGWGPGPAADTPGLSSPCGPETTTPSPLKSQFNFTASRYNVMQKSICKALTPNVSPKHTIQKQIRSTKYVHNLEHNEPCQLHKHITTLHSTSFSPPPTHTHARTHARMHAHTPTHTHTHTMLQLLECWLHRLAIRNLQNV